MNVRIFEFTEDVNSKGEVVEWVEYGPKDDQNTRTRASVKSLMPPETFGRDPSGIKEQHMTYMWSQIEPAYKAWKDGITLPEIGTPLGGWAALTKGQLGGLRAAGFKSVEEVRDMPESMIAKVRVPGVRSLITQAGLFLDGKDKSELARSIEEQSGQISALQEQLEAAMALLEEHKPKRKPAKQDEAA